jgi:hypothetical protein
MNKVGSVPGFFSTFHIKKARVSFLGAVFRLLYSCERSVLPEAEKIGKIFMCSSPQQADNHRQESARVDWRWPLSVMMIFQLA